MPYTVQRGVVIVELVRRMSLKFDPIFIRVDMRLPTWILTDNGKYRTPKVQDYMCAPTDQSCDCPNNTRTIPERSRLRFMLVLGKLS
jgi:hypothetical protein